MIVSLVAAAASNEVIGDQGDVPWYLPEDLRRFRRLTKGHAVIVGRVTHESIVARLGHPLPGRTSIVVSSASRPANVGAAGGTSGTEGTGAAGTSGADRAGGAGQVLWAASVDSALAMARGLAAGDVGPEVFVIGGASIYGQVLPFTQRVYLTRVHAPIPGDRAMPAGWLTGFRLATRDDRQDGATGLAYSFLDYLRELP